MFRKIKRCACACLVALLLLSLSGCKNKENEQAENKNIAVYSTFYPLYALTELVTDGADAIKTMCLTQPQDGCLRNYQLSDWDIALLQRSANAVIAGGRGLESFENTLFALGENGLSVSAVLYNIELDSAEVQGLQEGEVSHWTENPHLYMSIDGAATIAESIAVSMQAMDPEYSEVYSENLGSVQARLDELKRQMHEITGDISGIKVAILNEAIWYFAKDFSLDAVLCYHRESGESINNADEMLAAIKGSGAQIVLVEQQAPYTLVETLKDAGMTVAEIDILSTRRAGEGAEGYFEAQINNAHALADAVDMLSIALED